MKRSKLDPNREIDEAAQGDEIAIAAYNEFHGYISAAISAVGGRGILFDIHGQVYKHSSLLLKSVCNLIHPQKHLQNSTELGYLLLTSELNDGIYDAELTSVRALAAETGLSGELLLCGEVESLGALYEEQGFNALPSPRQPAPSKDLLNLYHVHTQFFFYICGVHDN